MCGHLHLHVCVPCCCPCVWGGGRDLAAFSWCSIQGAYRLESQGLQHKINFIIEEIGKEEPGAAERQSTDDRACRPGSDPSRATWMPWTAAAAQSLRWSSCQQATSPALSHVPSTAPAGRQLQPKLQPHPRSQPKRHGHRQQPHQKNRSRTGAIRPYPSLPAPRFRASRIHTDRGTAPTRRQRSTKEPRRHHKTERLASKQSSDDRVFLKKTILYQRETRRYTWTRLQPYTSLVSHIHDRDPHQSYSQISYPNKKSEPSKREVQDWRVHIFRRTTSTELVALAVTQEPLHGRYAGVHLGEA